MSAATLMAYFTHYGVLIIFLVIFLEHLNLPGFPAGLIMPLAGIWVAKSGGSLLIVILISIVAGALGSCILYLIGRLGGDRVLNFINRKFPKYECKINKNINMLKKRGSIGVFLSKLIPMIRTISSIPAGMIKIKFFTYIISSTLGIAIWNSLFISGGYFFGDKMIF